MEQNQKDQEEKKLARLRKKEFYLQTASMVITISVALLGIYLVLYFTGNTSSNSKQPENNYPTGTTTPISVQPSQYPDYDSLQALQSVAIVTNATSSESNESFVAGGITKHLQISGNFSRLYLYAEASVNDKPLTDWDSLYIKIDGFGGHLYRPDSLATPSDNQTTRLLFNASSVPYLPSFPYSSARTPLITNWFDNIFNANTTSSKLQTARVDTFISTTRQGEIHLIALYYACADSTQDCYIKVVK